MVHQKSEAEPLTIDEPCPSLGGIAVGACASSGGIVGRVIEHLAQVGQEGRVLAERFARGIGKLGHRLSVAGNELHDDVQGLARCVVCQVRANAETRGNPIREVFIDFKRPRKGEAVRTALKCSVQGFIPFMTQTIGLSANSSQRLHAARSSG
jgi:hypothetical protein